MGPRSDRANATSSRVTSNLQRNARPSLPGVPGAIASSARRSGPRARVARVPNASGRRGVSLRRGVSSPRPAGAARARCARGAPSAPIGGPPSRPGVAPPRPARGYLPAARMFSKSRGPRRRPVDHVPRPSAAAPPPPPPPLSLGRGSVRNSSSNSKPPSWVPSRAPPHAPPSAEVRPLREVVVVRVAQALLADARGVPDVVRVQREEQ